MTNRPAKYQTIIDDLRRQIRAGDLAPGARLPSQQQLADTYRVTLMTLRRALGELQALGLLHTAHGSGTYVADEPLPYPMGHLASFAQEMTERGAALTTEVLSIDTAVPTDDEVGAQLELVPGERVLHIMRRRRIDGAPIVLQHSYVPDRYAKHLTRDALESSSLYDVLRRDVGIEVMWATETLRAVKLGREHGRLLDRKPGAPGLLSRRQSFGPLDRPVVFDRALLPGDAIEVVAERHAQRLQLSYRVT